MTIGNGKDFDFDFSQVHFSEPEIKPGDPDDWLGRVAHAAGIPLSRRTEYFDGESPSNEPCYRMFRGERSQDIRPHAVLNALFNQSAAMADDERFADDVARKTEERKAFLVADRQAREQLASDDAEADKRFQQALEPVLLSEVEEPEVTWRIENLIQTGWVTLLWAAAKTGKTTALVNLAHSLLSGKEFLGKFAVTPLEPDQRIGVLNYEMTGANFKSWCQARGVDTSRVAVWNLRGMPNLLASELGRDRLAQEIQAANVGFLIIDTYSRAKLGEHEDDNPAAAKWFRLLEELLMNAGISEFLVTHHAGHQADRLRGASALRDNPDCLWGLTRGTNGDAATRYLAVEGRFMAGGGLERTRLEFDPETLTLTLGAGAAEQQSAQGQAKDAGSAAIKDTLELNALLDLLPIHGQQPGMSGNKVYEAMKNAGHKIGKDGHRLKELVASSKGKVVTGPGPRGSVLHSKSS